MACVCSMSQIGFPPKRLNLAITLPSHITERNLLPRQFLSRITFQDMKRRMASSLKRLRAAITVMYRIGEHTTRFKIAWFSMEKCAICLDAGLVMVGGPIELAPIFHPGSNLFFPWRSK